MGEWGEVTTRCIEASSSKTIRITGSASTPKWLALSALHHSLCGECPPIPIQRDDLVVPLTNCMKPQMLRELWCSLFMIIIIIFQSCCQDEEPGSGAGMAGADLCAPEVVRKGSRRFAVVGPPGTSV
jgi:hypothetical protein